MSLRDIMVHIDASQQYLNRLELAVDLAKEHRARLTGLYVVTHQPYKPDSDRRGIAEAEEIFRIKTSGIGIETQWLLIDQPVVLSDMVEVVNYHAHTKDLVIVGQAHGSQEKWVPRDLPERVVLASGRPTLVVPYAGSFPSTGQKVIVAWNSGRASARALQDAFPFLSQAREVCLLEIRPPAEPEAPVPSQLEEIAENLERHGITVKIEHLVTGSIPVANILMNYAWENGCDLIVMGAYSSTGRGTVHLGPVANQMLDMMTLPILLSH